MAPSKWDDEEEASTPPSSPPPPVARRSKFEDEEDDSDVLESWDAADDSDAEREKAKKAADAKAKADAESLASKKSKTQRIEERRIAKLRQRLDDDENTDESSEDEAAKIQQLRKMEKEADLKNAEDLFGAVGLAKDRTNGNAKAATTLVLDVNDPTKTVELSSLKLFDPTTRDQFIHLRETMIPLIAGNNAKKAQYTSFLQEFTKQIAKDLPSDQIKKIASGLTTLSNEKMKEEKAADKGGKKTKAAKSKVTLNATRNATTRADTELYDEDGLDDGDFM